MFSISDTKKLFRLLATASPTPCPYFELATGTGIVTEKRARAEVVTLIRGAGRTSTFDIANELGLDPKVVGQRLLPTDVDGWGRVGGSTIIKTEEFARLGSALAKELQGVVAVQEFCRGNQIDRELLVRLLPPGCEWLPLGGERECVYDAGYYEGVKAGVLERLRDASKLVCPFLVSEVAAAC